MTSRNTLNKTERLKSRKLIDELFRKGKSVGVFPLRVVYHPATKSPETKGLQVGVTASARNFKHAADRNRIKRLIREAWRVQKNELNQRLIEAELFLPVFIIYTAKELPEWTEIHKKTGQVIKKLEAILDQENSIPA